jgi:hypothetical protein
MIWFWFDFWRFNATFKMQMKLYLWSLTSSSGGYINGRNSANLELLIDKTSSIYLYVY